MLLVLSLLIVILTIPFSIILANEDTQNLYVYSKQLIFGVLVISSLALIINFLFPLNHYVTTSLVIISILIILRYKKKFLSPIFLKFLVIQSLFLTLILSESNVYRPDAGLYHLPYIGILNSEKIILGLSNLHFRYAHTSILQYFSAASNNIIFGDNGIVFAQALIAVGVITNFLSLINRFLKKKEFGLHFYFIFFVLIFIFYKMNRYSEYGNDAPAHFLYFFLISELIIILKKKDKKLINNLFLTLFIVQNKILLIPVFFLNIINVNLSNIKDTIRSKKFLLLNFIFICWIIKNLLTSGCLIYPAVFTCSDSILWTDLNKTSEVSRYSEAWSKGWSDLEKFERDNLEVNEFIKDFNWFDAWSKKHLKIIINIISPYIILSVFIICFYFFKSNKKLNIFETRKYLFLLSLSFVPLLIWFIAAPLFRYGYSTLITFLSILFSIILVSRELDINKVYKTSIVIIIFGLTVFISKNILRMVNSDNNYNNYPWPKFYSMGGENNKLSNVEIKLDGVKFYKPQEGNYCMYSKSICGNYGLSSDLKILKKNSYLVLYLDD